jgi:lipopolysaccharide biosynthesis glycosyltransferase
VEVQPGGLIPLFSGYDPRESIAYHVLIQSVLQTSSVPVCDIPLHTSMLKNFDGQQDGTNAFIYSRFLVPSLMNYEGWALYCDSDMLFRDDIAKLWALRDDRYAVMVVKHDYKTRYKLKAIGTVMEARNDDYPRKNWSSMVLWNCGHPSNKIVTTEFASQAGGKTLHRFNWLNDDEIGEIPAKWNHLVGEYPYDANAKLVHFTLGSPCFDYYRHCDYSDEWGSYKEQVERADCLRLHKVGGAHV